MLDINFEFKNVSQMVQNVLKECVDARADDVVLYLKCCEKMGAETVKDLYQLGLSYETVRRTRQKIQNEKGLYKPSSEVIEARKRREKGIRKYIVQMKV